MMIEMYSKLSARVNNSHSFTLRTRGDVRFGSGVGVVFWCCLKMFFVVVVVVVLVVYFGGLGGMLKGSVGTILYVGRPLPITD